jgi:hypothetical protein
MTKQFDKFSYVAYDSLSSFIINQKFQASNFTHLYLQ